MTTNDAYLYAKKVYRKHLTKLQLERQMQSEGKSEEDLSKVRYWLNKWTNGISSY